MPKMIFVILMKLNFKFSWTISLDTCGFLFATNRFNGKSRQLVTEGTEDGRWKLWAQGYPGSIFEGSKEDVLQAIPKKLNLSLWICSKIDLV